MYSWTEADTLLTLSTELEVESTRPVGTVGKGRAVPAALAALFSALVLWILLVRRFFTSKVSLKNLRFFLLSAAWEWHLPLQLQLQLPLPLLLMVLMVQLHSVCQLLLLAEQTLLLLLLMVQLHGVCLLWLSAQQTLLLLLLLLLLEMLQPEELLSLLILAPLLSCQSAAALFLHHLMPPLTGARWQSQSAAQAKRVGVQI